MKKIWFVFCLFIGVYFVLLAAGKGAFFYALMAFFYGAMVHDAFNDI